jgi:hypothetical protein
MSTMPDQTKISSAYEINRILRFTDTLRLPIPFNIDFESLNDGWKLFLTSIPYQKIWNAKFVRFDKLDNGTDIQMLWRGKTYKGEPTLWVELSVQKAIMGNNYSLIPAGTDIVSQLNGLLSRKLEIDVNITKLPVNRLDYGYNIQVDDMVADYIQIIGAHIVEGFTRNGYNNRVEKSKENNGQWKKFQPWLDNGLIMRNNLYRFVAYDKYLDCPEEGAKGILRIEASWRNLKAIKALTNKNPEPTLGDISYEALTEHMRTWFSRVKLDCQNLSNRSEAATAIIKADCKPSSRLKLLGYLTLKGEYPSLNMSQKAALIGLNRKTIYELEKNLNKTGIGNLTFGAIKLPPLRVMDDGVSIFRDNNLGDTSEIVESPIEMIVTKEKLPESTSQDTAIEGDKNAQNPEAPVKKKRKARVAKVTKACDPKDLIQDSKVDASSEIKPNDIVNQTIHSPEMPLDCD